MRIGYACINLSLSCRSSRTFRLRSYSPEMMERTVAGNLSCLREQLQYNLEHDIYYFRISSDLVPFASHPVCDYPWQQAFKGEFKEIGGFIKRNAMRVCMHPDQFILINSIDQDIHGRSVKELIYHAEVLDLLGVDVSHKIQIHVGGVYGDKQASTARFVARYKKLPSRVKRRLVVENDERSYGLADCLAVHAGTGVPIVFDTLHHSANNRGEKPGKAMSMAGSTWEEKDGLPMVDYSSQKKGAKPGAHAYALDPDDFRSFLAAVRGLDFDVMLEVKNKERSALEALSIAQEIGMM